MVVATGHWADTHTPPHDNKARKQFVDDIALYLHSLALAWVRYNSCDAPGAKGFPTGCARWFPSDHACLVVGVTGGLTRECSRPAPMGLNGLLSELTGGRTRRGKGGAETSARSRTHALFTSAASATRPVASHGVLPWRHRPPGISTVAAHLTGQAAKFDIFAEISASFLVSPPFAVSFSAQGPTTKPDLVSYQTPTKPPSVTQQAPQPEGSEILHTLNSSS
jgi:hypothetical protein